MSEVETGRPWLTRNLKPALVALVVALADAVVGTSAVEVELNPVLVGTRGAIAVDALWIEEDL